LKLDFLLSKFAEYLDNPPLMFFLAGALLVGLVGILLDSSIGNLYGIWVSLVYLVLIFGSLAIFDYYFDDFHLDFIEDFDWVKYMTYSIIGLVCVLFSAIIVSAFFPGTYSLWKIWQLSKLGEEFDIQVPSLRPIVINFMGIAQFLGLDAGKMQDALTNFFLVAPGEELTFRGVLTYGLGRLTTLGNTKGQAWVGGMIATGIWAGIHAIAAYTIPGMVLTWVLIAYVGGVIMLLMMVLSVDISTAITIHAIYNTICVFVGK